MVIKFQTPSDFIFEFTPQNAELKKLGLLTRTGFLEIGMRFYDDKCAKYIARKGKYIICGL